MTQPNVLFVMTDQQRWDTIRALGNEHICTPNLDRLVRRGVSFVNGYSTCPVCVAARYTIRTGCEPPTTRVFSNSVANPVEGQPAGLEERCGPYLARVMGKLGYRTFGVGKFHSSPWDEDLGYEYHSHSEELYGSPEKRARDGFASWLAREHPEYDYVETLMGERTEMYYMPQMSPLPAESTVERWAADRFVEQLEVDDARPCFGFVSFVGPHPPFAPPVPFNRMYDPDRMPLPVKGDVAVDHMDDHLPRSKRMMYVHDVGGTRARCLKARYYGEITYIDDCLGRILDAVEARPDAENTMICFFADHGDHLGDHDAWQKSSFFDAAAKVPYLVSWPAKLPADVRRQELVCLTDLFGIATTAAGEQDLREGVDVLGVLGATGGRASPREVLFGYHGQPGKLGFKTTARDREWKYIFLSNGGREQLFNMRDDPNELTNLAAERPGELKRLRDAAAQACSAPGAADALENGELKAYPFEERPWRRCKQFDRSRGVTDFPERPEDLLHEWKAKHPS